MLIEKCSFVVCREIIYACEVGREIIYACEVCRDLKKVGTVLDTNRKLNSADNDIRMVMFVIQCF
jgi:hypothetical protein